MPNYEYNEDLMLKGIRTWQAEERARHAAAQISDTEDETAWLARLSGRQQQRMQAVSERNAERAASSYARTIANRIAADDNNTERLRKGRAFYNVALDVICEAYGLEQHEVLSRSNERRIVRPRSVLFKMLRSHTALSYPEIGELLRRDHSTAIAAVARVDALLATDLTFRDQFHILSEEADRALEKKIRRAA